MTNDNAPNELVTEHMIAWAAENYNHYASSIGAHPAHLYSMEAALRAVAPMVAERACMAESQYLAALRLGQDKRQAEAVAAEREACAKIADKEAGIELDGDMWNAGWKGCGEEIAAAIRARGETPR